MKQSEVNALSTDEVNFLIETLIFKFKPWPDQASFPYMLIPPKKAWSRNIDGVMPLKPRQFTSQGLTLDKTVDTLVKYCDRLKVEYCHNFVWIATALVGDERIVSEEREVCHALARQLLKVYLVWDSTKTRPS